MAIPKESGTDAGVPRTWGHFTLLELVGAGANGEVWRAWDALLHRDVAVKFLTRDSRVSGAGSDAPTGSPLGLADGRLIHEARALARVQHPNVATIHGIAEMDGRSGLWMELLRGPSLAAEIERLGALPCAEVARIGVQLADALGALAQAGLVHRDIKPANIVLEPGGRAVLADFGLGWKSRTAPGTASRGAASRGAGTPVFMAPSLLDGGPATPRTDLYALGVTLRWALTGKAPFRARTLEELRTEAARGPASPLAEERPDAPPNIVEAIERAIRVAEEGVPFHAAGMRALLERSLAVREPTAVGGASVVARASPRAASASVAVLPFQNRGDDASDDYFSDGLAEEMIAVLSKLEGLHVTARTSSFQFKGKGEEVSSIGRKLNVSMILEGSVTKSGDRVRIAVGLVNAASGDRMWSATYDRTLGDIFALQDEIAGSVVRSLRVALMAPAWEAGVAVAARGRGASPEAHRLYLEARYLGGIGNPDSIQAGVERMLEVVRLEPRHALAWVWLCRAWASLTGSGLVPPAEGLSKSEEAGLRAVELAPDVGEAHAALGHFRMGRQWDWKGADTSLRRALELSPNNAEALRSAGVLARLRGRFDVAVELHRRSVELDPLSPTGFMGLGHAYRAAGRLEEAEASFRMGLELAPQRRLGHSVLALVCMERGRLDEAWAEARIEEGEVSLMTRAVVLFAMGRRVESDGTLEELIRKYSHHAAYQIAQVHASRGSLDEAFQWLDRAHAQRDAGLADVGADPLFRSLRGDARWVSFLAKMGLGPG